MTSYSSLGFPDSSVGKESACNAGDPGSIPGSGRSPGEGIGYPLQYSWASLVVQLVKNPPAMWETWVWSLGWEDSPGKGEGSPFQYSGLENSMDYSPWSREESDTTEWLHFHFSLSCIGEGNGNPLQCSGESQGRGSLVGCRLWGRTESDMTEAT